ncbi:PIG-L family deacetylase [Flavobacterium sediminilitoris]|uniref:PIG-L family deacetylase n=1 Tax=Flavobacterium sediminilitoris TaxID=2024526 RepID=A0ABY4HKC5_9FLAO|nr:PIG-L family deacetylase [Flavobacterium sediminilitoris]UOX33315.1 PIG-L family deacetylase [Flavobacterium sediminilitoris]
MIKKYPLFLLLFTLFVQAQAPKKPNSNEIYEAIQKLNFLGKVLYVAAHPDDENTRLITYFANHYHAETAYLSLTRGDGGQNLIGPELREKLGAIRTQELLAARNIDGGNQFFTRANDFGYSKEPNETFSIWNKEQVLEDVIQVMETFQPDIVINRFNHRTPGTTHGHHTASAILSLEAYNKLSTKPSRVFFNTSWWFYGSEEAFEKADKSNLLTFNANVYYPLKGKSNHEIAALSRSQHKCQGFGATGSRGSETEYLELLKGSLPNASNIFEGIDTSWNRIKNGATIGQILNKIEVNFDFKNPSNHIPELVKAYLLIQKLDDSYWKTTKTNQISKIIEACSGLYLEAITSTEKATKNETITINFEAINRSNSNVKLLNISILNQNKKTKNKVLLNNEKINFEEKNFKIPNSIEYTNLFWLKEKPTVGMYQVSNKSIRILPEEKLQFPVIFSIEIEGTKIDFVKNLVYKKNDPEKGETYIPFSVLPEVTSEIVNKVSIFNNNEPKEIVVKLKSNKENSEGTAKLILDSSWKVEPKEIPFSIASKNEEKTILFKVFPPKNESSTDFSVEINTNTEKHQLECVEIKYDHIPKQTILQPSEGKLVKLDIQIKGKNIGYLIGAGDEVGKNLENIGYQITYINPHEISVENLNKFDAVILGIRAFNTIDELKFKNKELFQYVSNGGNLIVQYNTTNGLLTKEVAPYELVISRDRVTNEKAKITFLNPNHPVLNAPNKITTKDFENWIQEQGLYYPNKWSTSFTPILSAADEGENQKEGALLIAKHGKGNYIYTGLSFFRELPEGVSGAYRLLANLISLDK